MSVKNKTTAKTATRHAEVSSMRGDAAVYKLTPPLDSHEFVVVSAVDLDYGGFGIGLGLRDSETMIFPSDGERVIDWGELAMVPLKSHSEALAELGYEVSA